MNTKLTLSIKRSVIEDAKRYAQETDRSLSSIVEEYLKSLSQANSSKNETSLKIVEELRGSVKDKSNGQDYKDLLKEALIEKHTN